MNVSASMQVLDQPEHHILLDFIKVNTSAAVFCEAKINAISKPHEIRCYVGGAVAVAELVVQISEHEEGHLSVYGGEVGILPGDLRPRAHQHHHTEQRAQLHVIPSTPQQP